jgi:hypothetical protein
MAVRRNEFQEIIYAIFSLIVFSMIGFIILKDFSIESGLENIIRTIIIIGFLGVLWTILDKIWDIIKIK